MKVNNSFLIEFEFQVIGNGADGFSMCLHNDPRGNKTIGTGGDGLGYEGISHCLSFEFDMWPNQIKSDPDGNHISIVSCFLFLFLFFYFLFNFIVNITIFLTIIYFI